MDTIRIGIVGAGAIAPSHIVAIERAPGAELAAVCDVQPDRAAALAGKHGVRGVNRIRDMLEHVDAVTLCTPSGFHLEPALEILQAGKHLLVEKPMEITSERVGQMISAARTSNVKLAGVFQSRFRPLVQQLKQLVADGLLGRIYSGSAYIKRYRTQEYYDSSNWRGTWEVDGGGCLMNQGIHLVDLLGWFCGDVSEVIAVTETVGREVEVETLALALLKFANGARGVIEATTLAYPELPQYLEIFGERGTLTFDTGKIRRMDLIDPTPSERIVREQLLQLCGPRKASEQPKRATAPPGTAVPVADMGHTPVVADFVAAIREDRPPLVDGREAKRSVELINAIYESGRTHSSPVCVGM